MGVMSRLGETALFEAVRNADMKMVKLLLEYRADVEETNHCGQKINDIADPHFLSLLYGFIFLPLLFVYYLITIFK